MVARRFPGQTRGGSNRADRLRRRGVVLRGERRERARRAVLPSPPGGLQGSGPSGRGGFRAHSPDGLAPGGGLAAAPPARRRRPLPPAGQPPPCLSPERQRASSSCAACAQTPRCGRLHVAESVCLLGMRACQPAAVGTPEISSFAVSPAAPPTPLAACAAPAHTPPGRPFRPRVAEPPGRGAS